MDWKCLPSESLEIATEKVIRSRWEAGVREAARHISRIRSGFCSDLRRERAARVFWWEVRGVEESGERIEK